MHTAPIVASGPSAARLEWLQAKRDVARRTKQWIDQYVALEIAAMTKDGEIPPEVTEDEFRDIVQDLRADAARKDHDLSPEEVHQSERNFKRSQSWEFRKRIAIEYHNDRRRLCA